MLGNRTTVSPLLVVVPIFLALYGAFVFFPALGALRASVMAGTSPVIIDTALRTGAVVFSASIAGTAWAILFLGSRPLAILLPLMVIGTFMATGMVVDHFSEAYMTGNGYIRCPGEDQTRMGKRKPFLVPAWTKPEACHAAPR